MSFRQLSRRQNVFWQFKSLRKPRGWVETSRNAVGKGNTKFVNNALKAYFFNYLLASHSHITPIQNLISCTLQHKLFFGETVKIKWLFQIFGLLLNCCSMMDHSLEKYRIYFFCFYSFINHQVLFKKTIACT